MGEPNSNGANSATNELVLEGKLLWEDVQKCILSASNKCVTVQNAIIDAGLRIDSATLQQLTIHKTRIKGDLILSGCQIAGSIRLSKVQLQNNLSLIDLDIGKDIILHAMEISGALEIDHVVSGLSLHLDQARFEKIAIRSSRARVLRYDAAPISPGVAADSVLILDKLDLDDEIKLTNLDSLSSLSIQNIRSPLLEIGQSELGASQTVFIGDCRCNTLKISGLALRDRATVKIEQSEVHILQCQVAMFEAASLVLAETTVSQSAYLDIGTDGNPDVDISSAYFQRLRLASHLLGGALQFYGSPFFRDGDQERNIKTAIILKKMFNESHDFGDEDTMFYWLKTMEQKAAFTKFVKHHDLRALYTTITYFLYRYFFGWGVRIRNPLAALGIGSLFFGWVYFLLNFSVRGAQIFVLHERYSGFLGALMFSVFAVLNLDPPAAHLNSTAMYLYLIEFAIGLFFITLIIGIIIRKIVR